MIQLAFNNVWCLMLFMLHPSSLGWRDSQGREGGMRGPRVWSEELDSTSIRFLLSGLGRVSPKELHFDELEFAGEQHRPWRGKGLAFGEDGRQKKGIGRIKTTWKWSQWNVHGLWKECNAKWIFVDLKCCKSIDAWRFFTGCFVGVRLAAVWIGFWFGKYVSMAVGEQTWANLMLKETCCIPKPCKTHTLCLICLISHPLVQ